MVCNHSIPFSPSLTHLELVEFPEPSAVLLNQGRHAAPDYRKLVSSPYLFPTVASAQPVLVVLIFTHQGQV